MSTGTQTQADSRSTEGDSRSAEQRAEQLMERVVSGSSRMLGRLFGRIREEVEDIYAEARAMHDRSHEASPHEAGPHEASPHKASPK